MSVLRWAFPSYFAARAWFDQRFTAGGKTCVLMLAVGLFPVLQSASGITALFAAFAALMTVAALVNFVFRPRMRLRLSGRQAVDCGDEVDVTMHISNGHWLTAYDLQLKLMADPRLWQVVECRQSVGLIEPAESISIVVRLRTLRRGVFAWPRLEVTSTFPFHLLRARTLASASGELVVYPCRPSRSQLPVDEMMAILAGDHGDRLARVGDSTDYLGNSEFRPGMRVRRWDYRSWARLNRPIVREHEEPRRTTVVLVVDTLVPEANSTAEPDPQFEAVLSAAATVMDGCAWHDITIEQLVLGSQTVLGDEAGAVDVTTGLEALARAKPQDEETFSKLDESVRSSLTSGFIVAVLSRWDSQRDELCRGFAKTGCPWIGLLIWTDSEPPPESLPEEVSAVRWPILRPTDGAFR
jgi:uncharacterized protein (DUF58 family)